LSVRRVANPTIIWDGLTTRPTSFVLLSGEYPILVQLNVSTNSDLQ